MLLKVNPHKIEIVKSPVNEKEINITSVEFEFAEEITEDYVKEAYFTLNSKTYKQIIINNQCNIPYEVLNKQGQVEIGVVAYLVENEEEIKRYNPSPVYISTLIGSLKDDFENSEPITPTDKEQMEQSISDMETKVDNLDIDATKEDKKTTITITKKDGTRETTEVLDGEDGKSLENIEIVNRNLEVTYGGETENLGQVAPNIQIGTTTTVLPSSEARVTNVGTDINPIFNFEIPKGEAGAIQMIIVNELPQTGQENTIYLVPLVTPESQENRYAEYVYINDNWELLGKIGIQVDLTDYYTKTETDTLLDGKADTEDIPDLTDYVKNTDYATNQKVGLVRGGVGFDIYGTGYISVSTYSYNDYSSMPNGRPISKGTLENVITGKDLTTKSYVDGLVGDINTALDLINGESV